MSEEEKGPNEEYADWKAPENNNTSKDVSRRSFLKSMGLIGLGMTVEKSLPKTVVEAAALETKNRVRPKGEMWELAKPSIAKLEQKFGLKPTDYAIVVNSTNQELYLVKDEEIIKSYPVSTAKKGIGSSKGSEQTPWGTHRIKEKFGEGLKPGQVLRSRQSTKEIVKIETKPVKVPGDYVTTRIMWLDGQENEVNKGGNKDSHQRFIYIHGTPEEGFIGTPASHGCVRMKNTDVAELFDLVPPGTLVEIQRGMSQF